MTALVIVLGLVAWQGAALAGGLGKPKTEKATAKNYDEKADCGGPSTAYPVVGNTTFQRKGDRLTIQVKGTDLDPNTPYTVYLYWVGTPGTCNGSEATLGTLKTNKKGQGNAKFVTVVPNGFSYYFSDAYNVVDNDSTSVYLP